VGAELAATPFAEMDAYQSANALMYFDVEGQRVEAEEAVFFVRCDLSAPEFVTVDSPGGELRRATVRIGFHQDPTNAQRPTRRTILLGNRGL
jgi:hypothetical protein